MEELLFWKVWRNVYLNHVIFTIGASDIEHIDYRKIHSNNKIKCKDIYSLKWMVDNGQLELLKYKLESGQYIEYSKYGFYNLVKSINTTNYQLGIDIFRLLEKRKSEYKEDIFQLALNFKNELVVEILLSEQQQQNEGSNRIFNGDISNLHKKSSLKGRNLKIIELTNCISLTERNGPFNYIMGLYINKSKDGTGYPNYRYLKKLVYKFPLYFDIEDIQCNGGDMKSITYLIKQLELNSLIEELKSEIIKNCITKEFDKMVKCLIGKIKIKQEQQHELMKLKDLQHLEYSYEGLVYLKVYQYCISTSKDTTAKSQKDQLDIIQTGINEITNSNKDQFEIDKEFMKLFIISVNSCYLHTLYYQKYFETIDQLQSKYRRNFKELVSISEIMKLMDNQDNSVVTTIDEILRIVKIVSGSIKDTTKNRHTFKCIILKVVQLIINCINSDQDYEMVIESLNGNNIFDLPLKWNKEFKQLFNHDTNTVYTITNIELIDWLSTDINKNLLNILYYSKRINGTIEFGSLELIKYAMLKLEPVSPDFTNKFKPIQIPPIKWSEILNNPFINLVNVNEFITTDNNEWYQLFKNHFFKDYQFKPILTQYVINYQISIGNGTNVYRIVDEYSNLDEQLINILLSSLLKSIIEYDLPSSGIILSILNFQSFENKFLKIWQDSSLIKQELLYIYGNICTTKTNSDTVIKYIRFWLSNKHLTTIEIFGYICNYLYKKLIQIQGISIELVEMIKNELYGNVIIKHSLYHSFYYLNVKSPKLIKYIMSQPLYYPFDHNYQSIEYDCTIATDNYDFIKEMLNPQFYTFEYIKSNSFTQILDQLFQFIHNIINKFILSGHYADVNLYSFHQLNYLLNIKRLDLFKTELEYLVKLFKPFASSISDYRKDFITRLFDGLIKQQQIQHCELIQYIELIFGYINELYDIEDDKSKLSSAQYSLLSYSIINYNQQLLAYCIDKFKITKIDRRHFGSKFHPLLLFINSNYPNIQFTG